MAFGESVAERLKKHNLRLQPVMFLPEVCRRVM